MPLLFSFVVRIALSGAIVVVAAAALPAVAADPTLLFDGKTFAGWNGDTKDTWRIENGEIVAGSPDKAAPRNEFLATDKEFENFELTLEYRMDCTGGCNAGVQFRSQRVPNHHEVSGYQADIAPGITGGLYDESRRNKMLGVPPKELQARALALSKDGWNAYTIRAEGRRIRFSINGMQLLDYTEPDEKIPLKGMIALQIHGGLKGTIRYRNLRIIELPAGAARNAPKFQPAPGPAVLRFGEPKQVVALVAIEKVHGNDVEASGPRHRSMQVEAGAIRPAFAHAEGWSPVAVRYAWADNSEGCNRFNAAGLPMAPFRTDDWK